MKPQSVQYSVALSQYLITREALRKCFDGKETLDQLEQLLNRAIKAFFDAEKQFLELPIQERAKEAIEIAECLYIPFTSAEFILSRRESYYPVYWPGGADCFEVIFGDVSGKNALNAVRIKCTHVFKLSIGGEFRSHVNVIDCLRDAINAEIYRG